MVAQLSCVVAMPSSLNRPFPASPRRFSWALLLCAFCLCGGVSLGVQAGNSASGAHLLRQLDGQAWGLQLKTVLVAKRQQGDAAAPEPDDQPPGALSVHHPLFQASALHAQAPSYHRHFIVAHPYFPQRSRAPPLR